ncbi:MAG: alpha/beta hydrolase [Chloroflexi bacterium]|nr:alpha/beta hydrolase [Chloroflexota bacterium]
MNFYLYLNNLRFHYKRWGGPPDGQPVVLLHGLASNARIWDLVAPRLVERGFRVFALDQRGHGLTDVPPDGYDFATITADLRAFVRALDLERPLLVGHSWGASTVLEYAARHSVGPPAGAPAGIVLVDGGVVEMRDSPYMPTWERAEEILRPPPLAGTPREEFLDMIRRIAGEAYTDQMGDIVLGNFIVREDDTIAPRLPLDKHMTIARMLYEQQKADLYPRVRCPVLALPATPPGEPTERARVFLAQQEAGLARLKESLPAARIVPFPDTLHDVPLHRPTELARAVGDWGLEIGDWRLET